MAKNNDDKKKQPPKKIEIKEREKPSPVSATPNQEVTFDKGYDLKGGRFNLRAAKSLAEKRGYAGIGTDMQTKKGGIIHTDLDTDKNLNVEYTSPKGKTISISKEGQGATSASYSSPRGSRVSVMNSPEASSASYTSPKGLQVEGHYNKGEKSYGGSIESMKGRLSYDSDKNIGAEYRGKNKLVSARYNMGTGRGEVSARINLNKRKKS